ncbi:SAM-dependent methyltransferase [Umezawaea sp.]|uniref:SAM-dependent methyltransferase n=1 Tax=Umezawaea sp. TaxID=1955258 RepID=UPI002ED2362B
MARPDWAPDEIDLERPSIARVYDYWLGGAHNFAADRALADQALGVMPSLKSAIMMNRAFLRRAVQSLAASGVRQFLDLGSGIPTVGNVHEVARQAAPDSRVVYVDRDPVAVAHSRSLLMGDAGVAVLQADIRDPRAVLDSPEVQDLFDLGEPVAVLMVALLHFVPDSEDPIGIIRGYRDRLAPGSHLALSQLGTEPGEEPEGWQRYRDLYAASVTPLSSRGHAEVTAFFEGFDLVDPGVTRIPLWRPESVDDLEPDAARFPGFAGVGRLPG